MNSNSKYVVLNWMLPAIPSFPSPAMSLLKSQMQAVGYDVKVIYWNFKFLPVVEHYWGRLTEEYEDHLIYYLSPIFAYWALELDDNKSIKELHKYWNKFNKENKLTEDAFLCHINENVSMLVSIIHQNFLYYNFDKCLFAGYYQKLFQMYGADIVAREQKKLYPDTIAVFGGIDTKDEALACMDNFPSFDYALWGEGEVTLLNCASMLRGEMNKQDVGNLVWRETDTLEISKSNNKFVKLDNSVIPDYSDYFEQATIDKKRIRLPIEGSRGCHWSQCRFCFHNEGTRYRRKSPQRIAKEIRNQIEKYGISQISFLDNDTIGKDVNGFKVLLKELSCIKNDYPEFSITRAEVVTRSLNAELIRQMAEVGFKDVQIGYESLSDHLLEKIHKCNSFSSNFLYIKWAFLSGIKVKQMKFKVYMLSALLSSIAGVILTSRVASASPTAGEGDETYAIAAAVIGGASMSGGKGNMIGTIIGAFIIGVLNNGLNLIGLSSFWQQVAVGFVIILAVYLDVIRIRIKER